MGGKEVFPRGEIKKGVDYESEKTVYLIEKPHRIYLEQIYLASYKTIF